MPQPLRCFTPCNPGTPFSWGYVNTTVDGTGQANSLAYIPRDLTEAHRNYYPPVRKPLISWPLLTLIRTLKRGKLISPNATRDVPPGNNTLDLRLLHEFKLKGRQSIQISYDIINFLNLLNKKAGYYYFSPNTFNSTASIGLTRATNPANR